MVTILNSDITYSNFLKIAFLQESSHLGFKSSVPLIVKTNKRDT